MDTYAADVAKHKLAMFPHIRSLSKRFYELHKIRVADASNVEEWEAKVY